MICPRNDLPLLAATQTTTHLELTATLTVPRGTVGLMVLVESEGRRQPSPMVKAVAESLRTAGIGTCLVDLIDPAECGDRSKRKDIDLLTERLEKVLEFLGHDPRTWHLPVGLFGTGHAAAAALTLAAEQPALVRAAVSCCGRPDLALVNFSQLTVPTLLIAPAKNRKLVEATEGVFLELRCVSQLAIVRGASKQLSPTDTAAACEHVIRKWCRRHVRRPNSPVTGEGRVHGELFNTSGDGH